MAYTPYFRHELEYIDLTTGMMGPNFPVQSGLKLHTYCTDKFGYTTTSRMFGTTAFTYTIKGVKKDDLDLIKYFWETSLENGYNDFTIIDNKGRMLFEASWNNWHKIWTKKNGGVYEVIVDIEASVPWTPPVLGAYTMSLLNLHNHSKQGGNLAVVDGVITSNHELRLLGNGTSSQLVGATGAVDWKTNIDGSFSIFCQFRAAYTDTNYVLLAQMTDTNESIEYTLWQDSDEFGGRINGIQVGTGVGTYHAVTPGTWYDAALTYDSHNGKAYVYIVPTPSASFVNFLSGASSITEQIGSYMASSEVPATSGYKVVNLLKDDGTGGIAGDGYGYIKYVFFFDGFLSPMAFNMMRRLVYMWGIKTITDGEIYPK